MSHSQSSQGINSVIRRFNSPMSAILARIRAHPRRFFLVGAGVGACILAFRFIQRTFYSDQRRHNRLLKEATLKLTEDNEIDETVLDDIIRRLEALLHRLEAVKFRSERDRSRFELISSVLSRLKGAESDLEKFNKNDFQQPSVTEDIARSVWNAPASSRPGTLSVLSDDSFLSAYEDLVSALPEFESNVSISVDFDSMNIYKQGLRMAEKGEVKYRKSRADFCLCESETDFAAKLWCLRQAFDLILTDERNRQWLMKTGRVVIADLLRQDNKDPADFYVAYDRMMEFLNKDGSHTIMMEELILRKVECLNLWDVLFDFVFLDAFDDLRKPPSGISALLKNTFLSRSMKESTINNLIWSLIKAKRARLQIKDGFIAHFYDISQIVSLSLTMGLLGGSTKSFDELCTYFKENILAFVVEIFNPTKVRFTTKSELAEDVLKTMEIRLENIRVKLSHELLPT